MPIFTPETLRQIGYDIFAAAGCSPEDARTVTDHLVESSLFGHDSHGTLRFYEYISFIKNGLWDARGVPEIVQERPCTAVVDGGGAMGQVGGDFATRLAMDKARQYGTATVTLRNTSHVGRCGAYPLAVAREGMIGLVFVNAGTLGRQIAPFGGLDGKLSTNPIAFAAPRRNADPIMVDMATSMTAEGKIRIYHNRGQAVPAGWLIDGEGESTTDPSDYLDGAGGAILPLGGVSAYKGYCLSFIVEILGGALSGEGCAAGETVMKSNGVLIAVFDIEHFVDIEDYYDEMEGLINHVSSSRVDPRIGEILLPGEPEFRSARQRGSAGIEVDDTTWSRICDGATSLGLDPEPWKEKSL